MKIRIDVPVMTKNSNSFVSKFPSDDGTLESHQLIGTQGRTACAMSRRYFTVERAVVASKLMFC